jgi:hypothetical protein
MGRSGGRDSRESTAILGSVNTRLAVQVDAIGSCCKGPWTARSWPGPGGGEWGDAMACGCRRRAPGPQMAAHRSWRAGFRTGRTSGAGRRREQSGCRASGWCRSLVLSHPATVASKTRRALSSEALRVRSPRTGSASKPLRTIPLGVPTTWCSTEGDPGGGRRGGHCGAVRDAKTDDGGGSLVSCHRLQGGGHRDLKGRRGGRHLDSPESPE